MMRLMHADFLSGKFEIERVIKVKIGTANANGMDLKID